MGQKPKSNLIHPATMEPIQTDQQVRVDPKTLRQLFCKCGCKSFIQVTCFEMSPEGSNSMGRDIVLPSTAFQCTACKTVYEAPTQLTERRKDA